MPPLQDLRPGESATLTEVHGQRSFRRRLLELGLVPGTEVRLLRHSRVHHLVEVEPADLACRSVPPKLHD